MTHLCVGKLTIIGSNYGLSPERRQANIWTNAAILSIGPLERNFSEILIEIWIFFIKKNAFENVRKMASILSRPQWVKASPVKRHGWVITSHKNPWNVVSEINTNLLGVYMKLNSTSGPQCPIRESNSQHPHTITKWHRFLPRPTQLPFVFLPQVYICQLSSCLSKFIMD